MDKYIVMESLRVTIGQTKIQNQMILPFEQTQQVPRIGFQGNPSDYYTIMMVDPDAPSRTNPIYKYFLHLLIVNNDQEIASYHLPSPPPGSGLHRYIFYLLRQKNKLDNQKLGLKIGSNGQIERKNFNMAEFMHYHKLEIVDSVYFETGRK